ncbi:MAG: hypothetical protein ACE5KH_01925 [Candidatus Geothermarchaeales archaeon]
MVQKVNSVTLTTILKFKIKEYFGSVRASKGSFLLALSGLIWLNATGLIAGFTLPEAFLLYKADALLNPIAAFLSAYLAVFLMLSMRGGMTTFQAELDFLMTSPVRPRKYLVADLLFQLLSVHIFFSPMIPFVLATGSRLGVPLSSLLAGIALYEAYLVMGLMSMQGLGVVGLRWKSRWMKPLTLLLIGLLLLPTLGLAGILSVNYSDIPLPATLVSSQLIFLLRGVVLDLGEFFALLAYLSVVSLLYLLVSSKNFFQYARPTVAIAFGEVSFRARSLQTKRLIRNLGPFTRLVTLDYHKGGLLGFLARKELIRVIRDGSLLMVLLIFAIYGAIGLTSSSFPQPNGDVAGGPLFSLFVYSALVPTMLAVSWSTSERANLWIILVSGRSLAKYFQALFAVFAALAVAIPLGLLVIVSLFAVAPSPWLPLGALAVSSFSSALSIYSLVAFSPVRQGAFSTAHFFTIGFSVSGALLLSSPFLAVMALENVLTPLIQLVLGASLLGYTGVALYLLVGRIQKKAVEIEV